MRREGRIHGTNVRVNKKEVGSSERAANRTNYQSKESARSPGNGVGCVVKKASSKLKTALKARDLDVTKNHKMAEWSISMKDRLGNVGGDVSEDEHEHDSDQTEEYWADDQPSRSPTIECPIELLVQMRKPKAVRASVLVPDALPMPIPTSESDYESDYESVIDDESWSDFEFSDGEEISYPEDLVADVRGDLDWELITEFEGLQFLHP